MVPIAPAPALRTGHEASASFGRPHATHTRACAPMISCGANARCSGGVWQRHTLQVPPAPPPPRQPHQRGTVAGEEGGVVHERRPDDGRRLPHAQHLAPAQGLLPRCSGDTHCNAPALCALACTVHAGRRVAIRVTLPTHCTASAIVAVPVWQRGGRECAVIESWGADLVLRGSAVLWPTGGGAWFWVPGRPFSRRAGEQRLQHPRHVLDTRRRCV